MTNKLGGARATVGWKPPAFVAGTVLTLWVLVLCVQPILVRHVFGLPDCFEKSIDHVDDGTIEQCLAHERALYGIFGDSFGSANALFSGLALAGVVLTLYLGSQGARRQTKPFVVHRLRASDDEARVTVKAPGRQDGVVFFPLEITVPISNSSQFPAMNVVVIAEVIGAKARAVHAVDVPLEANGACICLLRTRITGDQAVEFKNNLCSDSTVEIHLRTEFDSVEAVRWYTYSAHEVKLAPGRAEDAELLEMAINGVDDPGTQWPAHRYIDLEHSTQAGTWKYGEV